MWIFTGGDPAAAARAILAEFEKPAHEPEDVRPALVLTKEQQRRRVRFLAERPAAQLGFGDWG